ncbi:MAG: 50S ribosomal protein L25 [Patescibacteria group bacterium]|nr:50S ribosomal protein L25 [Patescibacteria group bacterium]
MNSDTISSTVRPILSVQKRNILGRKVKKLRERSIIPANIFGNDLSSFPVSVNLRDFKNVYNQVGETGLVDLKVEDLIIPVLISNVSYDPVSGMIIHVDFRQVNLKEKLIAKVPIELTGESPAEKQGLGIVVSCLNEIEVEALPSDLPEKFIIDISSLIEINQSICVKDIKLQDEKFKVISNPELVIVKIEENEEQKPLVVDTESNVQFPQEQSIQ